MATRDTGVFPALNRQVLGVALAYSAGLLLLTAGLVLGAVPNVGWRVAAAAAAAAAVWVYLRARLRCNHPPDAPALLFPDLGAGNLITLLRAFLAALLASFLPFADWPVWLPWGPLLLWITASLLDFADGYGARRQNRVTLLGQHLDLEVDGFSVLVAAGAGVAGHILPAWFLGIALLRPVFLAALTIRNRMGKVNAELPDNAQRRLIAGLQTGLLGYVLWPGSAPSLATAAAWGTALLLLGSFGRDWLWTAGILSSDTIRHLPWYVRSRRVLFQWLPLSLRPIAVLGVITMLADPNALWRSDWLLVPGLVTGLAALLILAGLGTRTAGLCLMLGTGLLSTHLPYIPSMAMAVLGGMGLFLWGGGILSRAMPWDRVWDTRWGS